MGKPMCGLAWEGVWSQDLALGLVGADVGCSDLCNQF